MREESSRLSQRLMREEATTSESSMDVEMQRDTAESSEYEADYSGCRYEPNQHMPSGRGSEAWLWRCEKQSSQKTILEMRRSCGPFVEWLPA